MADSFTAVPLTQMRKIIAERMVQAKQEIPHFRLSVDLEVDRLNQLRRNLMDGGSGARPSLNDMLIKACATALMDAPGINIQWVDGEIRQFASADISVVMAVPGGLSTPIVREANTKSIWQISQEVQELGVRAKARTLKLNQMVGGSFSISNLGMYGIDRFDAIVNPPQCAILAVGAAKVRPIATDTGELRAATAMTATLSCDHRAIDGAMGAQFLAALRYRINEPEGLSLEGARPDK